MPAAIYRDQCGICHGDFGEGTSIGGELVDVASRHDEESLSTIVTSGVGVMPGTPSISDEELQAIVSYVLDNL